MRNSTQKEKLLAIQKAAQNVDGYIVFLRDIDETLTEEAKASINLWFKWVQNEAAKIEAFSLDMLKEICTDEDLC